jgi:diguanylate cyclase (GGDEF)-like protein/PAS domain S-box-containing protein
MQMTGSYDQTLVALSILVAILASFTALNLAGRLIAADRRSRPWWILAASLALGGGIWSMHFVGMLAFRMPVAATYDVTLTLLSLLLPILVVGTGLTALSRFGNGFVPLFAAGLLAGSGILIMHYSGMAAMRMPGMSVRYDPSLVAASILIAIVAATAAFWLAFRTTKTWERIAAAVVMGFAIAGMHYTGMAAAVFTMDDHGAVSADPQIEPGILAVAVVSATMILLLLGLITAFFDRKLATLTASEALALQQSEERLRALNRNASDIVAILNRDGIITYEASSAWRILGYRTNEMVDRPMADFIPPEHIPSFRQCLQQLLKEPAGQATIEIPARHADGSLRHFELVGKNLLHDPAISGVVVNMRDITVRKQLMAELERLSETDVLTNTLNRRGFIKSAEREFARMRGTGARPTLVMIDIDHFKGVNDVYGHAAGDMVLAMMADRCRETIRRTDILARFGGEEFVILLTEATKEEAHAIIARLQLAIAGCRVPTIKGDVSVTASFGMASVDPSAVDLETGIRLADEALYEAKNSGRNCIKIRA